MTGGKMNKKVLIALAVLVLAAIACSTTTIIPTTVPTSGGGGGSTSSNILYQDTFTDPNSGWTHHQTANSTMDYANGGYRINLTTTDMLAFATAGKSFQSDVRVEADATKTGGPEDNYIGVICRYQDTDNFYFFVISSDGFAGIAMYKANQVSILTGSKFSASPAINQGAATNHIRADCVGNTLTLSVNGQQVSTVTDSTFTTGGLLARANTVAGVDILFNNFVVSKP
jgi:hypothetical protein